MSSKKLSSRKKLEILKQKARDKPKEKKDEYYWKVQEISQAYERALSTYRGRPSLCYLKALIKEDDRMYVTWLRAAMISDQLNIDYETYIKAQFYYFDMWFNRAPKVNEIASYKSDFSAVWRAKNYVNEVKEDKLIIGPSRPITEEIKVPQSVKNRNSERNLNSLMKAYKMTEEEIILVFCKEPNNFFDKNWLKNRPSYIRLKENGEI